MDQPFGLAIATISVGEATGTHERDFRLLLVTALGAVIPAGSSKRLATILSPCSTLANAWHGSLLTCRGGGSREARTLEPGGRINPVWSFAVCTHRDAKNVYTLRRSGRMCLSSIQSVGLGLVGFVGFRLFLRTKRAEQKRAKSTDVAGARVLWLSETAHLRAGLVALEVAAIGASEANFP